MPFCGKCGTQLSDSAKFCPSCGTPLAEASPNIGQQQPQQNLTEKIKKLNDTEDTTALFDEQDIGALCVFGYTRFNSLIWRKGL